MMSIASKPFNEIHSIHEMMEQVMAAADKSLALKLDPPDYVAASLMQSMSALQWLMVELGTAATQDRLLKRLSELMEEHQFIIKKLSRAKEAEIH